MKAVAEEMGIGFVGIGFQPKWGVKDIPVMPKVLIISLLNYLDWMQIGSKLSLAVSMW